MVPQWRAVVCVIDGRNVQCGAVITCLIVSQIFTKDRRAMGCPLWIQHLTDNLPQFLQLLIQYLTTLDRAKTYIYTHIYIYIYIYFYKHVCSINAACPMIVIPIWPLLILGRGECCRCCAKAVTYKRILLRISLWDMLGKKRWISFFLSSCTTIAPKVAWITSWRHYFSTYWPVWYRIFSSQRASQSVLIGLLSCLSGH